MAEEPANLVLEYLRRIDRKVDELSEDMREVKRRLILLEEGQAIGNRRLDRMDDRLSRFEKRFDLV
jgi:hypothetical protein